MEQITLYFKEGTSDKVYQASIEPKDGEWVVNFAYGRRGSTLNTGTKTSTPVSYDEAKQIFDKLVAEKKAKGYTPGKNGTPYQHTDKEQETTGIHCQLLNPVDGDELDDLLQNLNYWMQEKFDGRRLLIKKEGESITGINRLGLTVGLPKRLIDSALELNADFIMDGEAIGECLHAFDLLSYNGADLRSSVYRDRYLQLMDLIGSHMQPSIRLVKTMFLPSQKEIMFDQLKAANKEGVVFKRFDATYTAGRPSTGGSQFKFKFCETASFIIGKVNQKRSVSLTLFDGDSVVPAGNVTIPPNHDIPSIGAVVEVKYLHAFKESGSIYQPVYLGVREDIRAEECTVNQLKYKAESAEQAA